MITYFVFVKRLFEDAKEYNFWPLYLIGFVLIDIMLIFNIVHIINLLTV